MPDQPRQAWIAEFAREVGKLRQDLTYYNAKYVNAVALSEWAKAPKADPVEAARAWHQRVQSARP